MLVLQRKKEQSIVIAENIVITIKDIASDSVKITIDAPKEVKILRKELIEAVNVNKLSVANKEQITDIKNLLKNNNIIK